MRYLIDTNICIYLMNRRPLKVIRKIKQFDVGDLIISSITLAELQYGVSNSQRKVENQRRLIEFVAPFQILAFDQKAAKTYGDVRYELQKKAQMIGSLDVLIAAHALSQGLTLVTNNYREFKKVKNLRVENWTR